MLGEFFDPKGEWRIADRCRPHWSQAGAVVFITFRTHDSIPREVAERWEREKQEWMAVRGHPVGLHWSEVLPALSASDRASFRNTFRRHRETVLDECRGRCLLRRPELA